MSESMAFVGGAALAGLAALLLLKGDVNLGSSQPPPVQTLPPAPVMQPEYSVPQPVPAIPPVGTYNFEQQRGETDQLKEQLEQQQAQTEQLKAQLQRQQMVIDNLSSQIRDNAAQARPTAAVNSEQYSNPLISGLLWAVAGMVLTITGGGFLVMMMAMLSRQQRPPRTVQVVHSMDENAPPSYFYNNRRRSEFLPPRLDSSRRNEPPTYYDN